MSIGAHRRRFHVFLVDTNLIGVQALGPVLDGVKVAVPVSEAEEARAFLAAADRGELVSTPEVPIVPPSLDTEALPAPPAVSKLEFGAVVTTTVGYFTALSLDILVRGLPTDHISSDGPLLRLMGSEALMASGWVAWLRRRGWSLARVTRPATGGDIARGITLAVCGLAAYSTLFAIVAALAPSFARAAARGQFEGTPSWWIAILVSTLNPVFEEFLYLGFIANVLRRGGIAFALTASVFARLLVHLYQGPLGVVGNLPLGTLWGAYYLGTGRLWPVIVAHALLDALSLGRLAWGSA